MSWASAMSAVLGWTARKSSLSKPMAILVACAANPANASLKSRRKISFLAQTFQKRPNRSSLFGLVSVSVLSWKGNDSYAPTLADCSIDGDMLDV